MTNLRRIIPLFVLIILFIAASSIAAASENSTDTGYYAKKGTLNLEHWDRAEYPIIELSGEWIFYPNQRKVEIDYETDGLTKTVSHFWEEDSDLGFSPYGFGTYRLRVTGLEPLKIYGLKILDEVTAYHLYANDVLTASNGVVGTERSTYRPQWRPVQSVFQADANGNAEFVMEIANYDYYRGGFWNPVLIGSVNDIVADSNKDKILDMFLFASIFIVGIINLILFFLYRYRDLTTLYFSLFCLCMSLRTLLIGQRLITDILPNSSWFILVRLEYLFGYCLLPLFGLFAISLLDYHIRPDIQKRLFQILLGCGFLLVLMPNSIYTAVLQPYKLLAVLYFIYLTMVIIKAAVSRQSSAAIMLLAVSGIIVSLVQEVFIGGAASWLPFAALNFILCFSLITFRKFLNIIHENEVLGTKAILDPLTGLFNRNYLMDLKETNRFTGHDGRETYLLFLDLDGFKRINDSYGHKIGDFVLQETGRRLKLLLCNTDIICRYGGDEFVVILEGELEEIKNTADNIIAAIQEPYIKEGNTYQISVSIGITELDTDTENLETAFRYSDQAMYEAKRNGGGRYFIRMK